MKTTFFKNWTGQPVNILNLNQKSMWSLANTKPIGFNQRAWFNFELAHKISHQKSGSSGYVSGVLLWPLHILIGEAAADSPI